MQNNFVMNNLILLTEFLVIFSHFRVSKRKTMRKKSLFCINISGLILAMCSSCYVLGETLWMHHLMKNTDLKCLRMFLCKRCATCVHLYNVNSSSFSFSLYFSFFCSILICGKKMGANAAEPLNWK